MIDRLHNRDRVRCRRLCSVGIADNASDDKCSGRVRCVPRNERAASDNRPPEAFHEYESVLLSLSAAVQLDECGMLRRTVLLSGVRLLILGG